MQKLKKKNIILNLVTVIIMVTAFTTMTLSAFAATVTIQSNATASFVNAQFYVLGSSNVPVYASSSGTKVSGSIYANDLCKVLDASGTYWKVSYPTSSSTKIAYCNKANILSNTGYCKKISIKAKETVYKKSDMSTSFGTVYTTDTIYMLSPILGGKAQIIYNVNGGYKIGWIYANDVPTPSDNPSAQSNVEITESNQKVDSLDGVSALYRPGSSDGSDKTYSCAAFAKRYFSNIYGVTLSSLVSKGTPEVSSGKLTVVSTPAKGDLAFWSGSPHSAIVKSVSGNSVILIEQNWKFKLDGKWYATINRAISKSSSGVKYYRWSK